MTALSEAERDNFLAEKRVAVLSVAATNGRPPATVPVWYGYTPGGNFQVTSGVTARKAKPIEQAGVVTLIVHREDPTYKYVIVEGTVMESTTPAPRDVREEIAIRYLGEEGGRAFVEGMADQPATLFTIRPDRWITADYGAY